MQRCSWDAVMINILTIFKENMTNKIDKSII